MERVMSELTNFFAKKIGLDIHLLLYGIHRDVFYSIPPIVNIHKPNFTFNNKWRIWYSIRTLFFLRAKLKMLQPNTVLSFGEYWNSFVLLACYGLPFPVYVSDRNQPDKRLGSFHDLLRKLLYPQSRGVIAQTHLAKSIYHSLYRHNNIEVIGNPIRFVKKKVCARENAVLMVGRLIRSKNQDQLIRLFAKIQMPDWKLVLVGYDHLKQENMENLKKLAKDLNVSDRVVFAGKQSSVDEYYNSSMIFAFTSTSEGFPNVIGEAMSAGLPVIAFDCVAGPADLIEDGKDGFLISINDFESFKIKLQRLMEDESLRNKLGTKAQISVQKYSIENVGNQYLGFITGSVIK